MQIINSGMPTKETIPKKHHNILVWILGGVFFSILWLHIGFKPLLGYIYKLSDENTFVCSAGFCFREAHPIPYRYRKSEVVEYLYYCSNHIRKTASVRRISRFFYETPGLPSLAAAIVFGLGGLIFLFIPRLRKKILEM